MDWVVVGAQWLHVLLGIIWFGNSLVVAAILIPSLNPLPILTQREVGSRYGERATHLFNCSSPPSSSWAWSAGRSWVRSRMSETYSARPTASRGWSRSSLRSRSSSGAGS